MRVNPADKVASLSVYTGVSSLSTSVSPGDNTGQLVSAHEWSTGITLNITHSQSMSYLKQIF